MCRHLVEYLHLNSKLPNPVTVDLVLPKQRTTLASHCHDIVLAFVVAVYFEPLSCQWFSEQKSIPVDGHEKACGKIKSIDLVIFGT
jgi:hypothetical protein